MRISKICAFFSILYLFSTATCISQQMELTFKKAVDEAFKNNNTIIQSQEQINAQDFNIKASYSDILPSLSFNSGWTRSNSIIQAGTSYFNGVPIPQDYSNTTTNSFNLSLRSDITLFDGLSNYQKVDESKLVKSRLVTLLQKTKQDIVFKLLTDYVTILKDQRVVLIDSATLDDSRAQLDRVKAFVEIGTKTVADTYKQDAIVAQNELAVEQAKNAYDKAIADLVFDANMSQSRIYTVAGTEFSPDITIESMNAYVERASNTEFLVATALRNRYDYKAAAQNIDVLRVSYDIADNTVLFPTLTGFTSYGISGNQLNDISHSRVFSVGLNLTYPIFEGFSLDNQRQQAIINLRIADESLNQVKSQIGVDIKKAVLDLKSLLKQVEISDRSLRSTEQDKIAAEEQYKVGLTTLLDVNTAEINYNNALITKSNLVYDFILAQKQLEYLQGLIQY